MLEYLQQRQQLHGVLQHKSTDLLVEVVVVWFYATKWIESLMVLDSFNISIEDCVITKCLFMENNERRQNHYINVEEHLKLLIIN